MGIKKSLLGLQVKNAHLFCILVLLFLLNLTLKSQVTIDIPKIRTLQLDSTMVKIVWEKSKHPGVLGYEINAIGFTGNNPEPTLVRVDSVGSAQSSYVSDANTLPEYVTSPYKEPLAFAVLAEDNKGNESKLDGLPWDSTIFLQASFDTCLAKVNLNWTPYDFNMWTYGTKHYVIMIQENNGPFTVYDRVNQSITNYQINDLLANNIYNFYIGAVADTTRPDTSTSNIVEINTGMARLPEYIHADYATYSGGNAKVSFSIDPMSEINTFELLRSTSFTGQYSEIMQLQSQGNKVVHSDAINYNDGPYFYKLDAINFCDENIRTSENTASTILLEVGGEPMAPELNWSEYQNWINGVSYYQIDRRVGDEEYSMLTTLNETLFTDNTIEQRVETGMAARVCYKVSAFENNNPYGTNAVSDANEVCIELPVNMRFEYDAFMPGHPAGNNTFGPAMDFLPDEIDFSIVDRSGQVVFNSTDPDNLFWDGTYNGNYVTQGAYMYVVKYRVGHGKRKTLRGGLVVAYP